MSPSSPAGSSSSLPSSNALLAIPDGPIPSGHSDRTSHCISLIGGYPTFPALPAASKAPESIRCGVCHEAIPLLAQVYCPPESGENDRTVYVWACPKSSCQRRDGSVRAFRASARNEEYMKDVAEKRAAAEKLAAEEREKAKKNPFTMGSTSNGSSLFGSAQPLFGAAPDVSANPFSAPNAPSAVPDISMLSINPTESTTMNLTTLAPPLPAYQPPQYISTIDEYLPEPDDDEYDMDDDEDGEQTAEQKAAEFADPRWEQLLSPHLDEVFERFVKRIQGAEDAASQVLRYDFGGVPLPYSSKSPLYHKIFPGAPTKRTPDDEEEPDFAEYYSTKAIPPCGQCGGGRIFELQLVPSLISQLQPESLTTTGDIAKKSSGKQTEEERKKELAKIAAALRDGGGDAVGEMEWGSIVVFGCENDCVGFAEEWVGVEWEGKLAGESS